MNDTSAQGSVINQNELRKSPPRVRLQRTSAKLRDFGIEVIPHSGAIALSFEHLDTKVENIKFFVFENERNILGKDHFDKLVLCIVNFFGSRIRSIEADDKLKSSATSSLRAALCPAETSNYSLEAPKAPDIVKKLCRLDSRHIIKSFVHTTIGNTLVLTVAEARRRVPHALLLQVKAKLDRMVRD